eukprot:gene6150-7401_t
MDTHNEGIVAEGLFIGGWDFQEKYALVRGVAGRSKATGGFVTWSLGNLVIMQMMFMISIYKQHIFHYLNLQCIESTIAIVAHGDNMSTLQALETLSKTKYGDDATQHIATLEAQLHDARQERDFLKNQVSLRAKDSSIKEVLTELIELKQTQEKVTKKLQKKYPGKKRRAAKRPRKQRNGTPIKRNPDYSREQRSKVKEFQAQSLQVPDKRQGPESGETSDADDDTIDLEIIAKHFPTLPIGLVLDCERKFVEADADGSGLIETSELDAVLSTFGSAQAVKEIIADENLNADSGLDLLDCLLRTISTRTNSHTSSKLKNGSDQSKTNTSSLKEHHRPVSTTCSLQ